tara:strand:- start:276 stop:1145 length:870 start_codon:yes stop_codon:yes gene_type:complete
MKSKVFMTHSEPFFSVVIPTYNRDEYLERAVRSVLRQSFKDFELLIVDDGSTDGTKDYLSKLKSNFCSTSRLKVINQKNSGVSAARNIGIRESSGKWIAFLDSDDEWSKKKLEIQKKYIERNPSCMWCHGNERWIRNGEHLNQKKIHRKSGGDLFIRSLDLCLISPSTVVINRCLFEELGYFKEDFIVCEDYDLWLRFLLKHKIGFCEELLITKYGGHEDQLSKRYKAMDYYRVKSMLALLDEVKSTDRKEAVKKVLKIKCMILISGYKKFGNVKHLEEIEGILRSIEN